MAAHPANLRARTVVIFDAGQADGQYVQLETHQELRLYYSPQGTEADDLIEELIALHSSPKQLQVVSSDHRLHKAARKRKATCLDSEAFVGLMLRLAREARVRQQAIEDESKPTGELAEETQAWLAIFSEVENWSDGVQPLSPRTVPPPAPPVAVDSQTSSPEREPGAVETVLPPIPSAELAFWEARLRDLLKTM